MVRKGRVSGRGHTTFRRAYRQGKVRVNDLVYIFGNNSLAKIDVYLFRNRRLAKVDPETKKAWSLLTKLFKF